MEKAQSKEEEEEIEEAWAVHKEKKHQLFYKVQDKMNQGP